LKIRYLPSQLPPKPTMYSDSGYLSFIRISQMFLFYFFFVLEAVVFELESCASYVIALTEQLNHKTNLVLDNSCRWISYYSWGCIHCTGRIHSDNSY
jgi:hypothetical protein